MKKVFYPTLIWLFIAYCLLPTAYCFSQGIWTQKNNFSGIARWAAVGFSIGTKGYIGTGYTGAGYTQDFWEYDATNDSWTQKADFGGAVRQSAVGFSIGTKGYIGTGYGNGGTYYQDFWEYDSGNNSWTQKANFGGGNRIYATGISIGSKGYIGTGWDGSTNKDDFWEYNPANDTWTAKANYGGGQTASAAGFSIGTKGYLLDGSITNNFWEYDPAGNSWTKKSDFTGTPRGGASAFSIGTKGYMGLGKTSSNVLMQDLWEYDQPTDAWIQKANFGGAQREVSVGFAINNKGYFGTGADNPIFYGDVWQFTDTNFAHSIFFDGTNDYVKVPDNSALNPQNAITVSAWIKSSTWGTNQWDNTIVSKDDWMNSLTAGYVLRCGAGGILDFNIASGGTWFDATSPASMSLNTWNYVTGTFDGIQIKVYINGVLSGTKNLSGTITSSTDSINIGRCAYAASLGEPRLFNGKIDGVEIWNKALTSSEINIYMQCPPKGNESGLAGLWTFEEGAGISTMDKTTNGNNGTLMNGAGWNFDEPAYITTANISASGATTFCQGNSVTLTASVANSYLWSNNATTQSIVVSSSGNYSVTVTNACASSASAMNVTVNPLPPTPTINANLSTLSSSASTGNQWYLNGNPIGGATSQFYNVTQNGFYTVCVTDVNGCSSCSAPYNFPATGMEENNSKISLEVFPNPFTNNFVVTSSENIFSIEIYNVIGEKIYTSALLSTSPSAIDMSNQPRGIYFLHLKTSDGMLTQKIIKSE